MTLSKNSVLVNINHASSERKYVFHASWSDSNFKSIWEGSLESRSITLVWVILTKNDIRVNKGWKGGLRVPPMAVRCSICSVTLGLLFPRMKSIKSAMTSYFSSMNWAAVTHDVVMSLIISKKNLSLVQLFRHSLSCKMSIYYPIKVSRIRCTSLTASLFSFDSGLQSA